MKKRNKRANGAEAVEEVAGEEIEEAAQLPELTKAEIKALWSEYRKAEKAVHETEAAFEAAKRAKSDAVKAIYEQSGRRKVVVDGNEQLIRKRGDTYFFTSPGGSEDALHID